MATRKALSDMEWQILQVIWEQKEVTVRDVRDKIAPNGERAYTTIQTYMERMVEKGLLTKRKLGMVNFFKAAIAQDQLQRTAAKKFINRAFRGNIGQLASFLVNDFELSSDELQQLKTLISQKEQSDDELV